MKFRVGDLVKLRAGGHKMEIIEIEGNGAICEWYLGTERHEAWVSFTVMASFTRQRLSNPLQVMIQSSASK